MAGHHAHPKRLNQSSLASVLSAMGLSAGIGPGACGLLAVLFPKPTNQRILGRRPQPRGQATPGHFLAR